MSMNSSPFSRKFNILRLRIQIRFYTRRRDPFPTKICHYLNRAKLIDSIRLSLRSNNPNSTLPTLISHRLFDSFVVTHALRSAPCADSALSLIHILEKTESTHFSHTQNTLHALATVLAKSEIGMDFEAVEVFHKMVDEGSLPNCRSYSIIIEHLVKSAKFLEAIEVFNLLPLMRIKRTLKQYSVLIEGLVGSKMFDEVGVLVTEMQVDGILPNRTVTLLLKQVKDEGFLKDMDDLFTEICPDERIKNVRYSNDSSDEDENDDEGENENGNDALQCDHVNGIRLKPWLDPRCLASALQNWSPDEVSALEDAKFVWTTRLVCKILRSFNKPDTAWNFFCWVADQPGFTHNIYTVQRIMTFLARHGRTELVDKLISKIRMEGMRLPFSTLRLIIDFYGISKNADAALKVFNDDRILCGSISKVNMMLLFSSLLRTLTKCGKDSDALEMLDEMILNGICPDIQTFSGLMQYFSQLGDIKTAQTLFSMLRQSGFEPDAYLFKVLIEGYCKSKRAALAWRLFEDMKNSGLMPDFSTKELLVKSLWREGRRREAAAVEESCEEVNMVLPPALPGHVWTVSSADLTRVFNIYSNSFTSKGD
ncbi:pentatricopeptide repeat-containing protein At5g66631 isoform X2 [Lathyrus oleraceus]|uniref:pentatricopeptide repeat-containing protein At5g66631 isoform X2 n=1 Tax=Pisum sativum TaxID=3888 RepID=UPI0021CF931D|nr:pentatricopeptide repeat-containing protein At5g66631 isoform X2 [Pisum sativum]